MMVRRILIISLLLLPVVRTYAQTVYPDVAGGYFLTDTVQVGDTLINPRKLNTEGLELPPTVKKLKEKKPHSPRKATILAMVLPGAGQLYNDQWYYAAVVYAGAGAAIYGLDWNTRTYKKYRTAFVDYTVYAAKKAEDPDYPYPAENSWDKLFASGTAERYNPQRLLDILQRKKNSYKRDRDLMYIVTGGIYVVQILHATVFAHFYDYEINEDLSINFKPSGGYSPQHGGSAGFTFTLTF